MQFVWVLIAFKDFPLSVRRVVTSTKALKSDLKNAWWISFHTSVPFWTLFFRKEAKSFIGQVQFIIIERRDLGLTELDFYAVALGSEPNFALTTSMDGFAFSGPEARFVNGPLVASGQMGYSAFCVWVQIPFRPQAAGFVFGGPEFSSTDS